MMQIGLFVLFVTLMTVGCVNIRMNYVGGDDDSAGLEISIDITEEQEEGEEDAQ